MGEMAEHRADDLQLECDEWKRRAFEVWYEITEDSMAHVIASNPDAVSWFSIETLQGELE